jgi:tetratricopeptide (TPR) repeat protein/O-antigen ligase
VAEASRLEGVCEGLIEAGWLGALAVVPLYFNVYSGRSFEPDKVAVLHAIVALMVAAWLAKLLGGGRAWRPIPGGGGAGASARGPRPLTIARLARTPLVIPALLIAATTILSSALSVDPRASWLGSYHRDQGTITLLCYLIVFGLALAHLRSWRQWRRIVFVLIAGSLPIALYAVVQSLGVDPVPWGQIKRRVASTAGNPIFLGAYLEMVLFVTAMEMITALGALLRRKSGDGPRRSPAAIAGAAVLTIALVLQLGALVLSQSRGPLLGFLAGAFIFTLVLSWTGLPRPHTAPPGTGRPARWASVAVIALAAGSVLFLAAFNLPGSPLAPLRDLPYLGRLGTALDLSSRTAQVRLFTWQGAIDVLRSDDPLRPPHGEPDPLHSMRPLVGHGPETFGLAFNRYQPAEMLRVEKRMAMADRAHNETFELLVVSGIVGYLAWMSLYCSIFYLALKWLGLLEGRRRGTLLVAAMAAGALVGFAVPVALKMPVLVGIGVPLGLLAGLAMVVALFVLSRSTDDQASRIDRREAVILVVLATTIAHFVEVHFGMPITASRLALWTLAAILAAVGSGWIKASQGQVGSTRLAGLPVAGLLTAIIGVCLVFGFTSNWTGADRPGRILTSSLSDSDAGGSAATLWMLVFCWAGAAALVSALQRDDPAIPRRGRWPAFTIISLGAPLLYALLLASRLARTPRMRAAGIDMVSISDHVARHATTTIWFLLAIVAVTGLALGIGRGGSRVGSSPIRTAIVAPLLLVATIWLISAELRPVRADTLHKHGRAFDGSQQQELSARLLERAAELDPSEPMHLLYLGRSRVGLARRSRDASHRAAHHLAAQTALERARAIEPLNPDHTANVARILTSRSAAAEDDGTRSRLRRRAAEEFAAALELRPNAVEFIGEYASLLVSLDEKDLARQQLERAVRLDPDHLPTALQLASLHRAEALAAEQAGDRGLAARRHRDAILVLEAARRSHSASEEAARALAALYVKTDRRDDAIRLYHEILERYDGSYPAHRMLALLYLEADQLARALEHARKAVMAAPPEDRARAFALEQRIRRAAGTTSR